MNWFRRLVAWRWLPFLGLTFASVAFVCFALLFAGGATSNSHSERASQKSAAGALRFDDFRRGPIARDTPAILASSSPQPQALGGPEVRSFFPPPAMELPPPLEEEEPVPEPSAAAPTP